MCWSFTSGPHDLARPPGCLDEVAKQLLGEVRNPCSSDRGEPARIDGQHTRHGTMSLFMVGEPLAGRSYVFVRAKRKRPNFTTVTKALRDEVYPQAEKIVLVMNPLNPHGVAINHDLQDKNVCIAESSTPKTAVLAWCRVRGMGNLGKISRIRDSFASGQTRYQFNDLSAVFAARNVAVT